MQLRKTFVVVVLPLYLMLLSPDVGAIEVSLEVYGGIGIPVGSFVDGYPVDSYVDGTDPFTGESPIPIKALVDVNNKVGFVGGLSLILSGWEIRYQFTAMKWNELEVTHLGLKNLLDGNILFDVSELAGNTADASDLDTLFFHTISAGYRFYFLDGRHRPYLPVGLGFAIAHTGLFDKPLMGVTIHLGLGYQFKILKWLSIGIDIRYCWIGVQNPETLDIPLQNVALTAAAAQSGAFETVLESLHKVDLVITTGFHF